MSRLRFAALVAALLAAVPLGLVVLGGTGPTTAQDAAGQALVGSWRLTVTEAQGPPRLSLVTFAADGTVIASGAPVAAFPGAPGGVVFTSAGHGAWAATGPETADFTVVSQGSDGQGRPFGTDTVRATLTLGADGQSLSGEGVGTIADPAGTTLASFPGTIRGTRIAAEGPGTPAAGTPAP